MRIELFSKPILYDLKTTPITQMTVQQQTHIPTSCVCGLP